MKIRDAVETDLPAIIEIYNTTISSRMVTGDTEPVSVESRLAWFHRHTSTSRPLWVLELDSAIAGWLSLQPFYGRPAYHATAEVSVYASPTCRRRGVGQRLVEQAVRHSPALGLTTLLGFIFAHNQPSLRLFEKFGFERWGYLPQVAELDGIERDLVIVGLRVDRTKPEAMVFSLP